MKLSREGFGGILLALCLPLAACGPTGVQTAGSVATRVSNAAKLSEIAVNDLYGASSKAGEALIGTVWTKDQFKAADRKAYDAAVAYQAGNMTLQQLTVVFANLSGGKL